jgi:hypothetical protein
MNSTDKNWLYDQVVSFSALGWHRTGSDVEEAAALWLQNLIEALGGTVGRQTYSFPEYSCEICSAEFHLEPLYYSWTGDILSSSIYVAALNFDEQHSDANIKAEIDRSKTAAHEAGSDILVLLTGGDDGDLIAINQPPKQPGEMPVLIAAGKDRDLLLKQRPEIFIKASIENRQSRNLIARFGDFSSGKAPLLITTPLSGWFNCAGERGTGLAIAMSVAETTGREHPVILLCPTGH